MKCRKFLCLTQSRVEAYRVKSVSLGICILLLISAKDSVPCQDVE